jgi:excisionase family DNA binding protein
MRFGAGSGRRPISAPAYGGFRHNDRARAISHRPLSDITPVPAIICLVLPQVAIILKALNYVNVGVSEMDQGAFSKKGAARYLSISVRTLEHLIATGELPIVKLQRRVLIRKEALDTFLQAREEWRVDGTSEAKSKARE